MKNQNKEFDINKDGKVTENEIEQTSEMLEIHLREEKAETQKRMAWIAMVSMIGFTLLLFSPFVDVKRVESLSNLLGMFYIAQAGIVGAYMGVTAWMSNTATRSSSYYSTYGSSGSSPRQSTFTPSTQIKSH